MMSIKLFVVSLANNLFDQINADALHRVTYTTNFVMDMIIAHVNTASEHGLIGNDAGVGPLVWEELSAKLKNMGWTTLEATMDPSGVHPNKLDNDELPWSRG